MDPRKFFTYILFIQLPILSVQQRNESIATILKSFIDVEGNKAYKYMFGNLIDKEPESSIPNNDNGLQTGDQILSENQTGHTEAFDVRKLPETKSMLWPDRIIPYSISSESKFATVAIEKIKAGISRWETITCLKFVPKEELTNQSLKLGHNNYLNIFSGSGCYSYVGFSSSRKGQDVSLNQYGCMKISTILHELGHALGFYHEQNRSDRDDFLDVQLENVKKSYQINFKTIPTLNEVFYDYNSVMQYGRKYFSQNGLATMLSKDPNLGFLLGNDDDVTFYDIKTANFAYDCNSTCNLPSTFACENDGFVDKSCSCVCPDVVEGERCETVVAGLRNPECASKPVELGTDDSVILKSPYYPVSYGTKKCAWIIKSPVGSKMMLIVKLDDIPRNSRQHKCFHSLEIRYNLIGQYGPRFCGNTDRPIHLQSTGNIAMIILHAENDRYSGKGFEVKISTGHHGSVCIPNPCNGPQHVCHDNGNGQYQCKCPSYLLGTDCSIVDQITCSFNGNLGQKDLCLFSQSTEDELDWIPHEGATKTLGTGPSDDVTNGGMYLYLEASKPANSGQKAILTSAEISGGTKCLTFFYHMYGETMGKLQLFVHSGNKTYDGWLQSGDHGNKWNDANITLRMSQTFRIELLAERGPGFKSDIAIDSLHLSNKVCDFGGEVTDNSNQCSGHLLGPFCNYVNDVNCRFDNEADNGGWCIFQNEINNNLRWIRHEDKPETQFTGLSSDVTETGYYLYVDASTDEDAVARMETLLIQDGVKCIDFNFEMYGKGPHMATLNVTFVDVPGHLHSFILSHNETNRWHAVRFSVESDHLFKVMFTYSVGAGFRGDVAIDAFSIADGPCMGKFSSVSFLENQGIFFTPNGIVTVYVKDKTLVLHNSTLNVVSRSVNIGNFYKLVNDKVWNHTKITCQVQ